MQLSTYNPSAKIPDPFLVHQSQKYRQQGPCGNTRVIFLQLTGLFPVYDNNIPVLVTGIENVFPLVSSDELAKGFKSR